MMQNDASAQSAPEEKTVRRVGTITLGLFLIALGGCLLGYYFIPGFPILLVQQLSPLILVALGVEVLYFSARPGRCRVDFASVLLCLALMVGCFVLAFVPIACERVAYYSQNHVTYYAE